MHDLAPAIRALEHRRQRILDPCVLLLAQAMAYAVNVSVMTAAPFDEVVNRLAPKLLTLRDNIGIALERATDAAGS